MSPIPAFTEASKVTAVDGEVVVDGPGGVGLAFTPDAARETGRRLATAAREAEGQDVAEPPNPDIPDTLNPEG